MGIRLTKIFIQNYKSIHKLSFSLSYENLFFGKNNAGKSTVLKAINLALEYEPVITEKDVFSNAIYPYSQDKEVVIDLCFEPEDKKANSFDSVWTRALKGAIGKLDKRDREVFAFRTIFKFNAKTLQYNCEKRVIDVYKNNGESIVGDVLRDGIVGIHLFSIYLNASNDINYNLSVREEYWNTVISYINLLKNFDFSTLAKEAEEDLIHFDSDFALNTVKEDMAKRSSGASSVYLFYLIKNQIETLHKIVKPFHCISLIEEPEAHMHPQAQMELMNVISTMKGQKYLCTHSSYILNHFPIHKLARVVMDEKEGTKIYKFDNRIDINELKTINLKCMLYKAEMMFANKVVLFEGQTEHIALPIYFRKAFGCYPFELGYSFVYVEGSNNYKAYLQICDAFHIDWFIFSDGEPVVISFLNKMMKQLTGRKNYDVRKDRRFVLIKNGLCYEDDLIYHGFHDDVSEAIDLIEKTPRYIQTKILNSYSWQQFKKESKKYNPNLDDFKQCLSNTSKKHKIDFAEVVARVICKNHHKDDLPSPVIELFNKIR